MTTATAALGLSSCGASDTSSPESTPSTKATASATASGDRTTLKVTADPDGAMEFTETMFTAKAGEVVVEFSNQSQVPHAVEIEGYGLRETTETVTGEDAQPIKITLQVGDYSLFCPIDGHRARGMSAKLIVL